MNILNLLKRSGVNAEAGSRPYVSADDYPTQMRKRTQKAVDDVFPQVQSELVRPYTKPSYEVHEYYQVPPSGIEPYEPPVFDPLPLPTFQVVTPVFSVTPGTYAVSQTVYITCLTAGATIYYTLDGTDPTQSKTKYVSAVSVATSATLKAKAFKDGMDPSRTASATYLIVPVGTDFTYLSCSDGSGIAFPFYITNIEFYDGGWETRFNPSYWTLEPGKGSWDGVKWVSEWDGVGTHYLQLNPDGVWYNNYRPTYIRISFTETSPGGELGSILLASRKASALNVIASPATLGITW